MAKADSMLSMPPTNTSAIDHPMFPPMDPTRRRFLAVGRELDPRDVLTDLLGSGDFPAEVLDPERAAELVIQRLLDAGFKIVPTTREDRS
jgi:hypothetical protein